MEIKSGQELFLAGQAMRGDEDLAISPDQALAVQAARERATESYAARYGDSTDVALEAVASGEATSLMQAYDGPLSASVLSRMLEAAEPAPAV